jgi:hypothetical protein
MPIHDWTRVDAGTFHDFHQRWTVVLSDALNEGILPPDYFAMVEQRMSGPIADVLTLELARGAKGDTDENSGGLAVATAPPHAQVVRKADIEVYARKANQVTVRHRHGKVIAVVEIVSPGNKHSIGELRAFVEKAADLISHGVHLLVIDLFPPTKRDPSGIAKAIWDEFEEQEMPLPAGRPLTLSACDAGPDRTMYVNFAGVGDPLPEVPLFIRPGTYVAVPLESTYETAWRRFPTPLKRLLG